MFDISTAQLLKQKRRYSFFLQIVIMFFKDFH